MRRRAADRESKEAEPTHRFASLNVDDPPHTRGSHAYGVPARTTGSRSSAQTGMSTPSARRKMLGKLGIHMMEHEQNGLGLLGLLCARRTLLLLALLWVISGVLEGASVGRPGVKRGHGAKALLICWIYGHSRLAALVHVRTQHALAVRHNNIFAPALLAHPPSTRRLLTRPSSVSSSRPRHS